MSTNKKDNDARKIGEALKRSTGLRSIDISVTGLTVHGAKSLADGISNSRLIALSLKGVAADHDDVMGTIYRDGIMRSKTIKSLTLVAPVGDIDALIDMLSSLESLKLWCSSALDAHIATKLGLGMATNNTIRELSLYFENQSQSVVDPILLSLIGRPKRLDKLLLHGGNDAEDHNVAADVISPVAALSCAILAGKAPCELEIFDCSAPDKDWGQFGKSLASPLCLLRDLTINKSILGIACVLSLSKALQFNTSVKKLSLCRNNLGNDGVKVLSQGLAVNAAITSLKLANNQIGDDGVSSFAKFWNLDSRIEMLNLACNNIGLNGAQELLIGTTSHPFLQSLSLAENVCVGVEGLAMIGKILPTLKLKALDISLRPSWELSCHPNFSNKCANTRSKRDQSGLALAQGMESNFHLHELSVSCLDVPTKYKTLIRFYTDLNKRGRCLLTKHNDLPPMGWCLVLADCADQPSFMYYLLLQKPEIVSQRHPRSSQNSMPR